MTRPLKNSGIDALESIFGRSNASKDELLDLKEELELRTTQRASTLLEKVSERISSLPKKQTPASTALPRMEPKQASLPLEIPGFSTAGATPQISVPVVVPTPKATVPSAKQNQPVLTEISVEQAYRILRVTTAASWDAIEASRRELVSHAQPDKTAGIPADKRSQLQAEAQQVNRAYRKLLEAKQANTG